jgi:serine/threonine-protein kinase
MKDKLDINIGEKGDVAFSFVGQPHPIAVREGINFLTVGGDYSKLPSGTLLTVQLFFADRVYGRVTHARTPSGDTFPVCMDLVDLHSARGIAREPDGGPDTVKVYPLGRVKAVREFK